MAEFLPEEYRNVPLLALRVSAREKISQYLNLTGRLQDETTGLTPDYNGLAELVGFQWLQQQNFATQRNPTTALLHEWTQTHALEPTVGNLVRHLVTLGRDDVLTDCQQNILRDVEQYVRNQERPIQDSAVTGNDLTDHDVDEYRCLTVADAEIGTPQTYDAFVSVCHFTSNDYRFVTDTLIPELEGPRHGLRLCVPWRDDLPGSSRYITDAHLISRRCKKMIIILSKEFLSSKICEFQLRYAHSLSPGAQSKMLIPVVIETCEIPSLLNHVSMCDYREESFTTWFWPRLAAAIKAPITYTGAQTVSGVSLADITLNIDPSSGSNSSTFDITSSSSNSSNNNSNSSSVTHSTTNVTTRSADVTCSANVTTRSAEVTTGNDDAITSNADVTSRSQSLTGHHGEENDEWGRMSDKIP